MELLDTLIGRKRAELAELETAAVIVRREFGMNGAATSSGERGATRPRKSAGRPSGGRRKAIAPGSVEDRIVEVLKEAGEPLGRKAIDASVKSNPYNVSMALKALVADARIVKTGATTSTRYGVR